MPATLQLERARTRRHAGLVRVTHWLTFLAFVALLITGGEIVVSHPRFYWGEVGNVNTRPLFIIPIPSSRDTVPTGYHYVLRDENGWSRYMHFEAAWVLLLGGLAYGIYGIATGHFRKHLLPARDGWTWRAYRDSIAGHLHGAPARQGSYNLLQQTAYLVVIFVLFPLIFWTGLAMSPSFTSAFPWVAALLGGRQSARTMHFFLTGLLLLFLFVHVAMVARSGFKSRMRAMLTGHSRNSEEGQ